VSEGGTHDELMKFDGYYLHFVLLPFLSLLNVKPIHSVCVCIFFLSIFR